MLAATEEDVLVDLLTLKFYYDELNPVRKAIDHLADPENARRMHEAGRRFLDRPDVRRAMAAIQRRVNVVSRGKAAAKPAAEGSKRRITMGRGGKP